MLRFYVLLLFISLQQSMTLYQFNSESNLDSWAILDDVVMGGQSDGHLKVNEDGHGEFYGQISLENNGGFSSVRHYFETLDSSNFSTFSIRLKGDGKTYQFRVKNSRNNRHSYIYKFDTSGDWQTIKIPFKDMYASFRGYRLDIPNFEGNKMEEIAFLIGNKKKESFKLLIDYVSLE
jgi:hypothetical protein